MKRFFRRFLILLFFSLALFQKAKAQDMYKLFTAQGMPADYEAVLNKAAAADIVFFGELHNSAAAHWLSLSLFKDLYAAKKGAVSLGMEMFESDQQVIIDEYLNGQISERYFENDARLWTNYQTDYKPLVEFCKEKRTPLIAANAPRRYAGFVAKNGLDSLAALSKTALSFLPSLPIDFDPETPCYKAMIEGIGAHGGGLRLAQAQALKDATMAHFIEKNQKKEGLFFHLNGAYHSNKAEGIPLYLRSKNPGLSVLTISCVEQKNIAKLAAENKGLGDFIIVIDVDAPKTY